MSESNRNLAKRLRQVELTKEADDAIRQLSHIVESQYRIECAKCGCEGLFVTTSGWTAGIKFYSDGWRVVDGQAMCAEDSLPVSETLTGEAGE